MEKTTSCHLSLSCWHLVFVRSRRRPLRLRTHNKLSAQQFSEFCSVSNYRFGFNSPIYNNVSMIPFPPLNLPTPNLRLRKTADGRPQVYDELRKRFVVLTAEEWVRQHFVSFLVNERGYPQGLLANEVGITVGGASRRCDTVLYAREGGAPLLIVEYKAPQIVITESVFTQVQSYNSVLRAHYLIVSNGLQHFCCQLDYENHRVKFLPQVPHYSELISY